MAGSKGSKYYDIFLDYAVKLEHKTKGNIIDEFKFQLIDKVKETGSLKLAAEQMGISYRKAWDSVEYIEKNLEFKILERQRGGAKGGKTTLTEEGNKLLTAHKELRSEFDIAIKRITKNFFNSINN